tara:strand:+ start:1375 stop:2871 length:1497 start_codon:yes stop_codon:yes gene_type:complete
MSTSMGGGSSSAGALVQLLSQGSLDQRLSTGATRTFWKGSYSKFSIFALESISQTFTSQVGFGSESQVTLNRQGDMLYTTYLKFTLPGLKVQCMSDTTQATTQAFASLDNDVAAQADVSHVLPYIEGAYTEASLGGKERMIATAKNAYEEAKYGAAPLPVEAQMQQSDLPMYDYAYWTEAIGFHLIRRCEFKCGGATIDTIWSELLFAMEELCGKSGRRLTETIGKTMRRPAELMQASRQEQILYVPLPFYFTRHPSLAFPLVSATYHNIQLWVNFAPLSSCIIKSRSNLVVLNAEKNVPIADDHLKCALECTYVHLDSAERDALTANSSEQLMVQHQAHLQQVTGNNITAKLNFNFPVSDLMFFIRRKANKDANDHFNFTGIGSRDPVVSCEMLFNNTPRVSTKPAIWWRAVQALQHHSSVPTTPIYSYSWALSPEDPALNPSGSVNMSRLDSCELNLQLQSDFGMAHDSQAELFVFARSWNILRFQNGLVGLLYSS